MKTDILNFISVDPIRSPAEIRGDQQEGGQDFPRLFQLPRLVHVGQLLRQVNDAFKLFGTTILLYLETVFGASG